MMEWRALCETIEIRYYGVYCFSHLQPLPPHLQPSLITYCVVLELCRFFASYETRRGVTKFLEALRRPPPNQLAVEPCLLQHVVPIVLEPVRHDDLLRLLERQHPGADFLVELVLDRILGLGPDKVRWGRAA